MRDGVQGRSNMTNRYYSKIAATIAAFIYKDDALKHAK